MMLMKKMLMMLMWVQVGSRRQRLQSQQWPSQMRYYFSCD